MNLDELEWNKWREDKLISKQYCDILECQGLDFFIGNFIWDEKRKKLFYVDF